MFDFQQRFDSVNHNVLVKEWNLLHSVFADIVKTQYKTAVHTEWCQEIHSILILLRLFAPKHTGRNLGKITSFNTATKKLILFKQVSDKTLIVLMNAFSFECNSNKL